MNIKNFYMLCALCCANQVQLKSIFSAGLTYTDKLLQMKQGDELWNEIQDLKTEKDKIDNQLKKQSQMNRCLQEINDDKLLAADYLQNYEQYKKEIYNAFSKKFNLDGLHEMKKHINQIPAFNDVTFQKYNQLERDLLQELYPAEKGYLIEEKSIYPPVGSYVTTQNLLSNRDNNIVFKIKKDDNFLSQEKINETLLNKIEEEKIKADKEHKDAKKKKKGASNAKKNLDKLNDTKEKQNEINSLLMKKQSFLYRLLYKLGVQDIF